MMVHRKKNNVVDLQIYAEYVYILKMETNYIDASKKRLHKIQRYKLMQWFTAPIYYLERSCLLRFQFNNKTRSGTIFVESHANVYITTKELVQVYINCH